jgi:hypothetical protein
MDHLNPRLPLRLFVWFLFLFVQFGTLSLGSELSTQSQGQFQEQTSQTKFKISVDFYFARLESAGSALEGFGFQGGGLLGITDKLGVGALVSQVVTGHSKSLFTQVSLEARFAITGSHILYHQTHSIEGRKVIEGVSANQGGLMAHAFIHFRRFLGGTGYGGGLSYEIPIAHELNLRIGARTDYATDWAGSHLFLQGFSGLTIWF